jgi:hypothetical protein
VACVERQEDLSRLFLYIESLKPLVEGQKTLSKPKTFEVIKVPMVQNRRRHLLPGLCSANLVLAPA